MSMKSARTARTVIPRAKFPVSMMILSAGQERGRKYSRVCNTELSGFGFLGQPNTRSSVIGISLVMSLYRNLTYTFQTLMLETEGEQTIVRVLRKGSARGKVQNAIQGMHICYRSIHNLN